MSVPMAPPAVFAEWLRSNMPPDTIISDPDWWAMAIWSAARRAINAAPVASGVPDGYTAVRTETLQWLLGERGDFVDLNPRNGKPRPYFWRSALREAMLASGGKVGVTDDVAKDAARWRWLRSRDVGPSQVWELLADDCQPPYMTLKHSADLDAAIDAAMLAAAPEAPR